MRHVSLREVLALHLRIVRTSGGDPHLLDLGALESAVAQPGMTFGGVDLYPAVADKAAALGFSLIQNHPFVDGNKRTGHAALRLFLRRHGFTIQATVDEQERVILQVAAGELKRDEFAAWLGAHMALEGSHPR